MLLLCVVNLAAILVLLQKFYWYILVAV